MFIRQHLSRMSFLDNKKTSFIFHWSQDAFFRLIFLLFFLFLGAIPLYRLSFVFFSCVSIVNCEAISPVLPSLFSGDIDDISLNYSLDTR